MLSRKSSSAITAALCVSALTLCGCGSGSLPVQAPHGAAPRILTQPQDASVPLGLSAGFHVVVTGDGVLSEQWYRNGLPVSGANAADLTTAPTVMDDQGAIYTFKVSSSLGSAESDPAHLTLTGRAPRAGDLRFQQVDAASTYNGYGQYPGIAANIPGRGGQTLPNNLPAPLLLTNDLCVSSPPPNGAGCNWLYLSFGQGSSGPTLQSGFLGDFYGAMQSDLVAPTSSGSAIDSSNSVITSLATASAQNLFALSYVQTSEAGGFDLQQNTVSATNFAAAAIQEGLHHRVITAFSVDQGQVTYFSYGWNQDTSTIYDVAVRSSTLVDAPSVAVSLANDGYIVTASGSDPMDSSKGIFLVGTKVSGDTLAHPTSVFNAGSTSDLESKGFSPVLCIETQGGNSNTLTIVGER